MKLPAFPRRWRGALVPALAVFALLLWWQGGRTDDSPWSEAEIAVLRTLWIGNLGPAPADPSNRVSDDPLAARLGHRLFFDKRLSATGSISCASCHQPERNFTDGLARGRAIGESARNTPSIVGLAWSPWLYWDGRKDSLWSQALAPLEDPNEHGADRHQLVRLLASDPAYRKDYEKLFGPLRIEGGHGVDRAFANLGKAIAAYERLLVPGPARFDAYVEALLNGEAQAETLLSRDERRGLRLFIGEARCVECHNGPLFSNFEFHNTGLLSAPGELPDRGRSAGLRQVLADPFNCLGDFSDAPAGGCAELRFVRSGVELIGAHRTPSLRNLAATAPYMHKGQVASLSEALEHYNLAPDAMIGHNEAKPLALSRRQLRQLEAFLHTLEAPLATEPGWLGPP